jgi:hypothetical protein
VRCVCVRQEQLNNLDAQIAGLAELDAAAKAAGPALPEHLPYAPWISWLAALLRQHATAQGLVASVAHALWTLSQKPHGSTHLHMRPILPLVLEVAGTFPWDCSDVWFPALAALSNTCINSTEQGCSAPIMSWVVPELDRVLLHACGIGNALSVLGAVWAVAGLAERCPANHVGLLPLLPSLKMVLQTDPSIKTRHVPSCLSMRSVTERRVNLATEAVLRALGEVAINGEKTQVCSPRVIGPRFCRVWGPRALRLQVAPPNHWHSDSVSDSRSSPPAAHAVSMHHCPPSAA